MTTRLFVALLQPLLALLLIAGAPLMAHGGSEGPRVEIVDTSFKSLGLARERADQDENRAAADRGDRDRLDGDGPEPIATLTAPCESILDRARIIRIGRSSYPTAPPSHRPCAAPPTGPPLA
jgi:hypothetical protein